VCNAIVLVPFGRCAHLTELNLRGAETNLDDDYRPLPARPSRRTLDLQCLKSIIGDIHFEGVSTRLPNLSRLDLLGLREITDRAFEALATCPALSDLTILF
jgi:hypothetical protein